MVLSLQGQHVASIEVAQEGNFWKMHQSSYDCPFQLLMPHEALLNLQAVYRRNKIGHLSVLGDRDLMHLFAAGILWPSLAAVCVFYKLSCMKKKYSNPLHRTSTHCDQYSIKINILLLVITNDDIKNTGNLNTSQMPLCIRGR